LSHVVTSFIFVEGDMALLSFIRHVLVGQTRKAKLGSSQLAS